MSGGALNILGVVEMTLKIKLAKIEYYSIVVRDLPRGIILGKNIMKSVGVVINLKKNTITFEICKLGKFLTNEESIGSIER